MNDYSAWNTPTPERRFPVKATLIGVGTVVVVGLAIFGVVRWRTTPAPIIAERQEGQQQARTSTDNTTLAQRAEQTGNVKTCAGLAPVAYDDCVWGVAVAKSDAAACKDIKDASTQKKCSVDIVRQQAVTAHDEKKCDELKDLGEREACVENVNPTTSVNCAARHKPAETCSYLSTLASLTSASDISACAKLSAPTQKALCEEAIRFLRETDTDGDGLSDADETAIYKSDPKKADTDGDGFKDGDEVKSGYSPVGPGKLVMPAR